MPDGKPPEGGEGETIEQVKAKLAEAESKLAAATGELIENRGKRAEVEGERDALKLKLAGLTATTPPSGDPAKIAEESARRVLAERDAADIKKSEDDAKLAFTGKYKEFSAENDPGGLKLAAVMARYGEFSKEGKRTAADFYKLLEDSYTLVNPTRSVPTPGNYAPFASSSPNPGQVPQGSDKSKLSPKEREVVERLGWTEEQYLKQKEKRPNYVASLLRHAE